MKLFGKRGLGKNVEGEKKEIAIEEKEESSKKNEQAQHCGVLSYFSPNFSCFSSKPSRDVGSKISTDVKELLTMDSEFLNSKQKRLIRRYKERNCFENEIKYEIDLNVENCPSSKKQNRSSKNTKLDENEKERFSSSAPNIQAKNEDIKDKGNSQKMKKDEKKKCRNNSSEPQCSKPSTKKTKKVVNFPVITEELKHGKTFTNHNSSSRLKEIEATSNLKNKVEQSTSKDLVIPDHGSKIASSPDNILEQLKNLNSKERRKLLRKVELESKTSPSGSKATIILADESRRIAEENRSIEKEKQVEAHKEKKKRKLKEMETEGDESVLNIAASISKDKSGASIMRTALNEKSHRKEDKNMTKSKPKKKLKDFSNLPPEERGRREKQRQMQQEARKRRELGEVMTRHPLNSERRRANRRKPGRAGLIAIRKKELKKKQETLNLYNASGYRMRHARNEK